MNADQLTRKIENLTNQVQPVEFVRQTIPYDFSLFTPKEQKQLRSLLTIVEPKYHWTEEGKHAGTLILDQLSNEELDQLFEWDKLQDERRAQFAPLRGSEQ